MYDVAPIYDLNHKHFWTKKVPFKDSPFVILHHLGPKNFRLLIDAEWLIYASVI